MKFKSALLTSASGSVGGMTASHNRGGLYLRARRIPVNTNTPEQQTMREAMGSLSSAWSGSLSEAQRAAWETYGSNVAMTNSLGDTIHLSGLNHYVRSNTPRIQAGLTVVDDAPVIFSIGETPVITDFHAQETDQFTIFANISGPATSPDMLLVYLSRPQSPGVSFFKGPYLFTLQTNAAIDGSFNESGAATPFPITPGQALFISCRVSLHDGRLSGSAQGRTIVG